MTRPDHPRLLLSGMEWPARCLDCGLVTEDPDAYVITDADEDGEYVPDHACPRTEREHRWAGVTTTRPDHPRPEVVALAEALCECSSEVKPWCTAEDVARRALENLSNIGWVLAPRKVIHDLLIPAYEGFGKAVSDPSLVGFVRDWLYAWKAGCELLGLPTDLDTMDSQPTRALAAPAASPEACAREGCGRSLADHYTAEPFALDCPGYQPATASAAQEDDQ